MDLNAALKILAFYPERSSATEAEIMRGSAKALFDAAK